MTDSSAAGAAAAGSAEFRSRLYLLLARVFAQELDPAVISAFRSPSLISALREAGVKLDREFEQGDLEQVQKDLAVEFAWLFLGPGPHLPPLESIQHSAGSGQLNGLEAAAVRRFIEQSGFDIDSAVLGFDDHLSVALEFLGRLAALEADARQRQRSMALQQLFIQEHLAAWVPAFCRKVEERATLPFYQEMAELLVAFIAAELERLDTAISADLQAGATP